MTFFQPNFSLLSLNTFAIDAFARHYVEFSTYSDLVEISEHISSQNLQWWALGGGSNVIFTGGFEGVVVRCMATDIEYKDGLVVADAGVNWDDLVGWCVDRGYSGLENLSYIPGTVGASPVQNIGAYGMEAGDRIEWVEYMDFATGNICRIGGSDCRFGYRDSIFKNELKGTVFVLRVAYRVDDRFDARGAQLDYGDLRAQVDRLGDVSPVNIRRAVIDIRRSKLPDPDVEPNAGSFFKNPVVDASTADRLKGIYPQMTTYPLINGDVKIPAGWLIDKAGWRGFRRGKVGVHSRQALVLVNYDGGSAADILSLASDIQADIAQKFDINIEMEVNVL